MGIHPCAIVGRGKDYGGVGRGKGFARALRTCDVSIVRGEA